MIRLALAAIFGAIALFYMGCSEVRDVMTYSHPTVLTYDQFIQQKPTTGWYTIKGGVLDAMDEVEKTENDEHEEYYVALIGPKDDPLKAQVHIVVVPDDPSLNATLDDASKMPDNPTDQQVDDFVKSHAGRLFIPRDVTGMVRTDVDMHDSIVQKMDGLDSDFVMIDEGHKPSIGKALLEFLGSIGCAAVCFFMFRAYRKPRKAASIQLPPGWGQQPGVQAPPPYPGQPGAYGQPPAAQPPYGQQPGAYGQPYGQPTVPPTYPPSTPPAAPAASPASGNWLGGGDAEAPAAPPPPAPAPSTNSNSWLTGEPQTPKPGESE